MDHKLAVRPPAKKIHPLWRWTSGLAALAIVALQIAGYQIARAINLNYFKDSSASISAHDVAIVLVALYLLLVAITGYWRIRRTGS